MTESDPQSDRIGNDYSRGPNPAPGGDVEPDADSIPPYADRSESTSDTAGDRDESVKRQMQDTKDANAGQTASPANESPVGEDELTDAEPEPALGVGESVGTRGEDQQDEQGKESGRHEGPTEHESERPTGYSDERDQSGTN